MTLQQENDLVICKPYLKEMALCPRHRFLILASDGLWEKLGYQESVDLLAEMAMSGKSPEHMAQAHIHLPSH